MLPPSRKLVGVSNAATVLRGGEMHLSDLQKNAARTEDSFGWPGLSVCAADGMTPGELLAVVPLAHAKLRITTAGALREAGFEVVPTMRENHHTIVLPRGYTPDTLIQIADIFQPPISREDLTGMGRLTTW